MAEKNRAAVLTGLKTLEFREVPMPQVGPDEILMKMEAVGVCGSDVHYYSHGRIGDFVVEFPFILGHECAGTVVEVGKDVKHLQVGDRVALEPGMPCGKCEMCRTGHYNLCPDVKFFATPPYDGCLMNYVSFPAEFAFKLPDNVSTVEGALVEPLAIGHQRGPHRRRKARGHGAHLRRGLHRLGDAAGRQGLRRQPSHRVRRDPPAPGGSQEAGRHHHQFQRRGPAGQGQPTHPGPGRGCGAGLRRFQPNGGPSRTRRPAGRAWVWVVGLGADQLDGVPLGPISAKELVLTSIFRYKNLYPTAISAIASGRISIQGIVSGTYSFEETPEAFRTACECATETVKNVIVFH